MLLRVKIVCALSCNLLLACLLTAQVSQEAKSILEQSEQVQGEDAQLAFLDSVCNYYRQGRLTGAKAIYDYRDSVLLARGENHDFLARVSNSAFYYIYIGELELAGQRLNPALQVLDTIGNIGIKADLHYAKSYLDERLQDNASSLHHIEQAITYYEELADSSDIRFGDSYKAKGRIMMSMGDFAGSLSSLGHAKTIFSATKDSVGLADVCQSQGLVYATIGLFDESKKYILERKKYMPNAHPMVLAMNRQNLARNELEQGNYEQAIIDYDFLIETSEGIPGSGMYRMYAFTGIIEANYFIHRSDEVQEIYHRMQAELDSLPEGIAPDFIINQCKYFFAMSTGEYGEAERLALDLYQGSLDKDDVSEAIHHAQLLAEVYKKSGQFEKALKYSELFNQANDSMRTANKTNALLLYQTKYETREKEMEIDRLAIEKKVEEAKGRTYLWIAGSLAALLLIGGYLILQLRKARKRLQFQNTELQALNATKTKFFGIIGHDLGGPLAIFQAIGNRIRRQISKQEIDKVEESVSLLSKTSDQVSDLLDNLLKWALTENGVMPYHPEALDLGTEIAKSAAVFDEMAKEKELELVYDKTIDIKTLADSNALSGVLRNLISNAIKFTPKQGKVSIMVEEQRDMTQVSVIDTGTGMSAEQIANIHSLSLKSEHGTDGERGTGLGLVLVKELVQINKGQLEIDSTPGQGTRISFSLPRC